MSNFRFDYNDIHKQVAIADLLNIFTLESTPSHA